MTDPDPASLAGAVAPSVPEHMTLNRNQSAALIPCLTKAADLSKRTSNLDLAATALYVAD